MNTLECFSPHDGEIVIKVEKMSKVIDLVMFPSPQWGSNSKGDIAGTESTSALFPSPQWGDNFKVICQSSYKDVGVSVPTMGR